MRNSLPLTVSHLEIDLQVSVEKSLETYKVVQDLELPKEEVKQESLKLLLEGRDNDEDQDH